MKNYLAIFMLSLSGLALSQVSIGKTTVNPSTSLDFGSDNRGMVLSWVDNVAGVTGAVNGTMVYDLSDKKIKVRYNAAWKDLSVDTGGSTVDPLTNVDGALLQNTLSDAATAKVSVGTPTATPGILVLEDTTKAMVLPKVDSPHLNINNPAPGMIVYDVKNKQLAVYNGKFWSFWKQ
jgi:CheY-specific phosphatase CheX